MAEQQPQNPGRARLYFAGALAAGLALALGLVLALGGSEPEREYATAPARCLELWNSDPAALAFGQHQSASHGYDEVQVLTLAENGSAAPGGSCAVVFAASALDQEPVSAAQILSERGWEPLSGSAEPTRLAALQSEAQSAYNARIGPDGAITPL